MKENKDTDFAVGSRGARARDGPPCMVAAAGVYARTETEGLGQQDFSVVFG
jgi:hypothetical protein